MNLKKTDYTISEKKSQFYMFKLKIIDFISSATRMIDFLKLQK